MLWLADECVDARIVAALRVDGQDVLHAVEAARGVSDVEILKRAQSESRLVLTEDKDFGDLLIRRIGLVPGLVLLRVHTDILSLKLSRLQSAVTRYRDKLFGRFTVIEASRFRSRGLLQLLDRK